MIDTAEFEQAIKNQLGDDETVLTVVILHRTLLELTGAMLNSGVQTTPDINALLTISVNRVKAFYRQRNIETYADIKIQ